MYLVLFGFGAVLTVAGIVLAGAGLSLREGTFDASLFTPGVVAAVGGLLLIGLGMALRTLQQIERALAILTAAVALEIVVRSLAVAFVPFAPIERRNSIAELRMSTVQNRVCSA